METDRVRLIFGLFAIAFCLASAEEAATETPKTFVDRSNGVETSIPGTTIPQDHQAQPVSDFVYNQGGNTFLRNEAGSIVTRPDGRTVLIGSGGQTIVTGGDSHSSEDDQDNDSDEDVHSGSNVVVNGGWINSHYSSKNGGVVLVNNGGEGSTQFFNNYQITVIDGGLQLKAGNQVYNILAKGPGVKSQENISIDGKQATVEYDKGNIVIELADGTVFAKTEDGLFSGNRQSYANRAQIKEDAIKEAAKLQQHFADVQNRIQAEMRDLEQNIQRSLENIRF